MQIIPVIDIKAGRAVLARQGHRQNYQPLSTPLCNSSQLNDVIHAYLNVHSFNQIYLADLDALMGTGNNQNLIDSIVAHFPELNFMIDCGALNPHVKTTGFKPVIGTESIDRQMLLDIKQQTNNFILSLDFSVQNKFMGDSILFQSPVLWPKDLIIMTLSLVGKNCGPDLAKLQYYCDSYPEYNFIAAGGIRHLQDLVQLKKIGIQQALVASALHNRILTTATIKQLIT